jgi:hypothetical protein
MEYGATIWNPYLKGTLTNLKIYKTELYASSKGIIEAEKGCV